jgi:hypothetical protein
LTTVWATTSDGTATFTVTLDYPICTLATPFNPVAVEPARDIDEHPIQSITLGVRFPGHTSAPQAEPHPRRISTDVPAR